MPLTTRSTNAEKLRKKRATLPSTIESTTKVSIKKAAKRRSVLRQKKEEPIDNNRDKENDVANAVPRSPGPTPYWEVMAERGGAASPPLTRSASKKKRLPPSSFQQAPPVEERMGGVVLSFSPPDQEANRRREKAEIARKEKERNRRIEKAKQNGQYLVFSPSNQKSRAKSKIPESNKDEEASQMDDASQMDEDTDQPVKNITPDSDNDEPVTKKPTTSLAARRHLRARPESKRDQKRDAETLRELEKVEADKAALETKNRRLESIKIKLERRVEQLEKDKQRTHSKSSEAKERVIKNLRAEIEELKDSHECKTEKLNDTTKKLNDSMHEIDMGKEQRLKLEKELGEAREKERKLRATLNSMQTQNQSQGSQLLGQVQTLTEEVEMLDHKLKDVEHERDTVLEELDQCKENVDLFENQLLPEAEEQREKAQDDAKMLEKACEELAKEMEVLKSSLDEAGREKKRMEASVGSVDSLKQQLESITRLQQAAVREFKDEKQLRLDAETKLESTLCAFHEKNEEIASWISKNDSLEKEKKGLSREVQDEKESKAVLVNEKNDALQKISKAVKSVEVLEQIVSQCKKRIQTLEGSLEAQTWQIQDMESQLKTTSKERDNALRRLRSFDEREADLCQKLTESDCVRRILHNKVMQLTGNIRVYLRIRPALPGEIEKEHHRIDSLQSSRRKRKHKEIQVDEMPFGFPGLFDKNGGASSQSEDDLSKNLVEITEPRQDRGGLRERRKRWRFAFDNVFTPQQGQGDVWEATEPLVQSAIDGFNVCIFAYGQTGSGKSFTMLGETSNEGVVTRAVGKLFAAKEETELLSKRSTKVQIAVELLEIYNEQVRDLLAPEIGTSATLRINNSDVVGNILVPTPTRKDVMTVLEIAQGRRCVKATESNAESSRSHLVFTIHYDVTTSDGIKRQGKLHVCDLAGSERLGKSQANSAGRDDLLKETRHINSSLSKLSNVIEKLQSGNPNVPFRESKLTMLLQNSLGGNSKTLAIVCCNPLASHFHESLCSLRFAEKVNRVDLKAVANFEC